MAKSRYFITHGPNILWKVEILLWPVEIYHKKSKFHDDRSRYFMTGWDLIMKDQDFIMDCRDFRPGRLRSSWWKSRFSRWQLEIFMITGQDFVINGHDLNLVVALKKLGSKKSNKVNASFIYVWFRCFSSGALLDKSLQ